MTGTPMGAMKSETIGYAVRPAGTRWQVVELHETRVQAGPGSFLVNNWEVDRGKWATRSIAERKMAEAQG